MNTRQPRSMQLITTTMNTQISIYNAAGSLVANVVGSQANVEGLAPGVYVVRVATANGIATTRIIKK